MEIHSYVSLVFVFLQVLSGENMGEKLMQVISRVLENYKEKHLYYLAIDEKFQSDDYVTWKNKVCGQSHGSLKFLNDSTAQNASFTAFYSSQYVIGDFIRNDFYYIQKSCLLDLFTIYVKSSIIIKNEDEKIRYAPTIIISPVSIYKDFFFNSIKLIRTFYPNALFMNISHTQWELNPDLQFMNYRANNYYEILFGYENGYSKFEEHGDSSFFV